MNTFDYFFEKSKDLDKDVILGADSISYRSIYQNSQKLAAYLKKSIGENQSVLILGQNSVFLTTAYLAVLKSGNVCVPLNPKIEVNNLNYIKDKSKTPLVFVDAALLRTYSFEQMEVIDEERAKGIIWIMMKGMFFSTGPCWSSSKSTCAAWISSTATTGPRH